MAQVEFYGDWSRLKIWIQQNQSLNKMDEFSNAFEELGKQIVAQIQMHIYYQDLKWKPLTTLTIARKGHPTVFFEYGEYYNSITSRVVKKRKDLLELQIFPDGLHSSGLEMAELAAYLEYGTSHIQARPLWRPVVKEIKFMKGQPIMNLIRNAIKFE
jgi:hypothetical protein